MRRFLRRFFAQAIVHRFLRRFFVRKGLFVEFGRRGSEKGSENRFSEGRL